MMMGVLGGGMEPTFIRTKIGNSPSFGFLIMLFYSSLLIRSLVTDIRSGRLADNSRRRYYLDNERGNKSSEGDAREVSILP